MTFFITPFHYTDCFSVRQIGYGGKGSKHEECRVCGYKKAAVEIPATGTPTEPGKPTDSDSPQTGDNSNMILWIALLFVSGGVVIGITVYSKKKKENAE